MLAALERIAKEARMCADFAIGLANFLRKEGVEVFHNPGALTVYFPRPSKKQLRQLHACLLPGRRHV
jgi:hypothetical protein